MKYIKGYNEAKKSRTDQILDEIGIKANKAKNALPEFINKISSLISVNHELDYIDEAKINSTIKTELKTIPYIEVFSKPKSSIQQIATYIVNVGYSIGYYVKREIGNNSDIDFTELIDSITLATNFNKNDNIKLNYKGPDILSSSILATCPNISTTINDQYDRFMEDSEDDDLAELKLIFGKIYGYGYGLGNDVAYIEKMEEMGTRNMDLDNKVTFDKSTLSPETLKRIKELWKNS